jgi:hypothetical protein
VENLEVKRLFGKPRRRWQSNFGWILKKSMGKRWTGFICRDKWRAGVITV